MGKTHMHTNNLLFRQKTDTTELLTGKVLLCRTGNVYQSIKPSLWISTYNVYHATFAIDSVLPQISQVQCWKQGRYLNIIHHLYDDT